jgi:hypothetical protein
MTGLFCVVLLSVISLFVSVGLFGLFASPPLSDDPQDMSKVKKKENIIKFIIYCFMVYLRLS